MILFKVIMNKFNLFFFDIMFFFKFNLIKKYFKYNLISKAYKNKNNFKCLIIA